MFQIAMRYPQEVDRVASWEELVSKVAKSGKATFFTIDRLQGDGIKERAEWSKTKHGGVLLDDNKIHQMENIPKCSSSYGLCE